VNDSEMRTLNDIAVKVGKLEAGQETSVKATNDLAASVNRLVDKMDRSDDIAREADQRARSAHHRIDEVKTEIDKKLISVQDDVKWLWRTVLTAVIVGIISGGAALVWKSIGGG
jgi:methyl-accepting chemotaxis protein